jgi:hypothetical protein
MLPPMTLMLLIVRASTRAICDGIEIVGDPGREELAECDDAGGGMASASVEIRRGQIQLRECPEG